MKEESRSTSRAGGFMVCLAAYLIAILAAVVVAGAMDRSSPIRVVLAADVAATAVIFLFSRACNNSSFYDPYWSLAPLPIGLYWLCNPSTIETNVLRQLLVGTLVAWWGVRLTYNWARSWRGLDHEDWRYRDKRDQFGALYWPLSFVGIHLLPTLLVFLGCLPLYPVFASGTRPLGALDLLAAAVTAGAIWIEARADRELVDFRRQHGPSSEILESGLWARCRHPNYLGEMGFWWGLWLFGLAAEPAAAAWTLGGAVSITLMFRFVSLPLIEQRMLGRRPHYARRVETLPAFIPRLGRLVSTVSDPHHTP